MKIEMIEHLLDIAVQAGAGVLEYSGAGARVRLVLDGSASQAPTLRLDEQALATVAAAPAATGRHVEASMTGVFYRAPGPDQAVFVEVGDRVVEGQVLAIVEAMKMLNPLESPVAGRIAGILASDGQAVEYGMPLFVIEENPA
ncbi:acetyl-CoA carboxylase biotin carboxyl carrier protein [Pseudomonas japonica]|uniref:Biotin carboxyl carrier protein of acetyl-CoA carboxylase n=1 Tax=Pseudomonas japonica TaxID=256466 RepID=A0A239LB84_9PSED|nr:biotin/lipoyl-containing protein [Pseudomonas japonica]SNT27741.1 biotin carboxyl carrier protein [Pseudomonas japonica]